MVLVNSNLVEQSFLGIAAILSNIIRLHKEITECIQRPQVKLQVLELGMSVLNFPNLSHDKVICT